MAEPIRRNFAEEVSVNELLPETATPSSLGAMPRRRKLDIAAENIGSAVGAAAASARGAQRRLQVIPQQMRDLRQQFTRRATDVKENIAATAEEWTSRAQMNARRAKSQMVEYCQQNPAQIILAVAGAAFATGVALRIWRSRA